MNRPVYRWLKVAVAGVVLGWLVAAAWLLNGYATVTLSRILVIGLLAVSVALLTGVAGLPTLGQTAPFAVGAYASALLTRAGYTVGGWHLLAAVGAGAAFATVTAPLVVRARGVVVLMITLALGELTNVLAGRWKSVTGGTDGLPAFANVSPLPGLAPLVTDRAVYLYILAVTGLVVAVVVLVLRSPAGALLRASRDNEARMRASGHPVTGYFTLAYVAAGAIAGAAGCLLVTLNDYVSPSDASFEVSALVLLAVVIGGAASLVGALAGAALVVLTRDQFSAESLGHAPLVLGGLFVLCVYLLPNGVVGLRLPGRRLPGRAPVEPGGRR